MPDVWYTFFLTLCARVYFARIRVIGAELLPPAGPILYVALHRNGAVDGFVYKSILPRSIFLIAAQLQTNPFSRMFFTGIPVVRDKDSGDRGINAAAMARCGELLAAGGELFVFPEGTSSLGPRHLPFKSGAARIAMAAWQRGVQLKIVPLGITYDAPSTFRSSVEVIVGPAIGREQVASLPREEQLAGLKHAITRSLENVGINVESAEYFEELRMIATIALPRRSSFHAMKLCEKGIPKQLRSSWQVLWDGMRAANLKQSAAASTFAAAVPWISLFVGLLLVPLVAVGSLLNFLPLAGAYWAGKKFPDAPNVISLWRILAAAPLFFLWFLAVFAALAVAGKAVWFLLFLLLTVLGWLEYRVARQFLVAGSNAIRFPELRRRYLEFQKLLIQELGKHEF
jgi:1-acyl-sn-glycerol-3-phosphate acyltransferase